MKRKRCAIGYLRFDKSDTTAYIKATKEFLRYALAKEGFKIIGFVVDITKGSELSSSRSIERFNDKDFFGFKHIVTLRREMLGVTMEQIDLFILAAHSNGFHIYSYVDKDFTSFLEVTLGYKDMISKVIDDRRT